MGSWIIDISWSSRGRSLKQETIIESRLGKSVTGRNMATGGKFRAGDGEYGEGNIYSQYVPSLYHPGNFSGT